MYVHYQLKPVTMVVNNSFEQEPLRASQALDRYILLAAAF